MLLDQCVCGETRFSLKRLNDMEIAECSCGVQRLVIYSPQEVYESQYQDEYHLATDRHPGCVPYTQRYDHDKRIASVRWKRYAPVLAPRINGKPRSLDVGCANGAFVDFMDEQAGWKAFGVEPNPSFSRYPNIFTGTIETAPPIANKLDLITYHDVLEHLVDPLAELKRVAFSLKRRGVVVVDVPDVATEAGAHHFKKEHLWYFTEEALCGLFFRAGMRVFKSERPIPGKLVVYGELIS